MFAGGLLASGWGVAGLGAIVRGVWVPSTTGMRWDVGQRCLLILIRLLVALRLEAA
jgi:hypothetical protein